MNKTPLVSIIVPAYNCGNYLPETLDSVLAQTYTNWEVIIINDGSTDDTVAVLSPFLNDSRITLVNQANTGVSTARNNGIKLAKGEYITFLDADDVWLPNNLALKADLLNNNLAVDFVFSNMYLADQNMQITAENIPGTDKDMLRNLLLWNDEVVPGPCDNVFLRKKCFANGLCFDAKFSTAADQDFLLYLTANNTGHYINLPLFKYRILPGSMSRNIATMQRDHIGVYKKAAQNNLFESPAFKRQCFANLYLILAGSWWVNGKNKLRGFYFILRAITCCPPVIFKLLKKVFK